MSRLLLFLPNGRFGPYISYKGSNYKIAKNVVPQDLDLDACKKIIAEQADKKKATPRSKASAKSSAASAAKKTTKKAAAKKA